MEGSLYPYWGGAGGCQVVWSHFSLPTIALQYWVNSSQFCNWKMGGGGAFFLQSKFHIAFHYIAVFFVIYQHSIIVCHNVIQIGRNYLLYCKDEKPKLIYIFAITPKIVIVWLYKFETRNGKYIDNKVHLLSWFSDSIHICHCKGMSFTRCYKYMRLNLTCNCDIYPCENLKFLISAELFLKLRLWNVWFCPPE